MTEALPAMIEELLATLPDAQKVSLQKAYVRSHRDHEIFEPFCGCGSKEIIGHGFGPSCDQAAPQY